MCNGARAWLRGATLSLRAGAADKRTYPMSEGRSGGQEELPCILGKEQLLHFAGAAKKRDLTYKVRETQVRQ